MIIGIDIDNVCVNTTEAVIDYINERLPINLKMKDIISYSIEEAIPQQYSWIVSQAFRDKQMWKKVKMIDDCAETIKYLLSQGHEVYFVTSSLPENLKKKMNHLLRHLPFISKQYMFNHFINIQKKQLLKLNVLIDDSLGNLIGEREYHSICFKYPWNEYERNKEVVDNACNTGFFTYIKNWSQIRDFFENI